MVIYKYYFFFFLKRESVNKVEEGKVNFCIRLLFNYF
jgi:hypothetical protein